MTLSVRNLDLVRGTRLLQTQLSFDVGDGEALWITGPNGVGKSTLLETLCGFRTAQGSVSWNGTAIEKNIDPYHEAIAYLGHQNANAPSLTAEQALRFYAELFENPSSLENALERLELNHRRDIPVSYLSAGQQRRLALARLLLKNAKLWILDEPTVSLDKAGAQLVRELILEHVKKGGIVVYTSHIDLEISGGREFLLSPLQKSAVNASDDFLGSEWEGAL